MATTQITVTKDLASCAAVALMGPTKIVGESLGPNDVVEIWEETATADNYQLVTRTQVNEKIRLDHSQQSIIFEGYGNYKFKFSADSDDTRKIGYAY